MAAPTQPSTMKAWLYSSTAGGLEQNLSLDKAARAPRTLRSDEVLIEVTSAALNPADYKVPEMGLPARLVIGMPASPGLDFCGRVAATGPDVTDFKPGDMVFGSHNQPVKFGALGEYTVSRASVLAHLPEGVNPDHAAALGIAGQSAYQALNGYKHVHSGAKVFINGGSGGCGVFAIQIAKQMGCHVTTTCSTRNVEFCRGLGADEVIDYTAVEDLPAELRTRGVIFDHILDHIGTPASLYRESDHFLREGGAFVQVGASAFTTFAERLVRPAFLGGGKRKYVIFFYKNTQEHARILGDWVAEGKIKVELDSVHEFEDAVQAFQKLRSGRARGKIIVHVGSS
ncbi:hypothetical protein N7474_003019 [Penicillium riverlandense]|uniref:uncharacterized protein n=1 Tax=Penicillium riverlandense TaxID=1903569 RepID=UPI0025494C07|nr:uncharacterized protein N7474_003019 [Penicillium riverlandense]KAJ5825881.1 hypothetical protein N7474_003019 [Penicillium riverlandense]